jgi:hypothetical protein
MNEIKPNIDFESATKLLEEFKRIPFKTKDTTYLELCQYPGRRFEEIISRLLAFYLDPNKEHGFGNMMINSLLEILNEEIRYDPSQIKIIPEDIADGKRIDLVIWCPDFVIGIENKITAQLYNPLEIYSKRIQSYKTQKSINIVLSVYKLKKLSELQLIKDNGFRAITYNQFFESVKRNIGMYISGCNSKYLTHLYDLIETIENKKSSYMNKELSDFIFDNEKDIKVLIKAFDSHSQEILNQHTTRIKEIQEIISEKTINKWWIYHGWDLGIQHFHGRNMKFGIESSFMASKKSPFDQFKIYITSWTLVDFAPYREKLRTLFPNNLLDEKSVNNRVYLHMEPIDGNDIELIVRKLKDYYDIVVELTREE